MPGRILPVVPQPTPQPTSPVGFAVSPPPDSQKETAVLSGLNANISTAASTSGYAYTASGIAYRCGAITFTVTAGIAIGTGLYVVTFQHRFRNPPIVLCGGGPGCVASLLASAISATQFTVFTATALGAGAGQVVQWIAIGV